MIALFLILAIVAGLMILPGWYWASRNQTHSALILLLPAAGLIAWALLTMLGFGPQSLANIMETPIVAGVAVLAAYLKLFVFYRLPALNRFGDVIVVSIVVLSAITLRALMPVLPE